MLPHVSVPNAAMHAPEATALADHPELPPGVLSLPNMLFVLPKYDVSVVDHIANSSIFVFPIISHQFFSKFRKQVALYGLT